MRLRTCDGWMGYERGKVSNVGKWACLSMGRDGSVQLANQIRSAWVLARLAKENVPQNKKRWRGSWARVGVRTLLKRAPDWEHQNKCHHVGPLTGLQKAACPFLILFNPLQHFSTNKSPRPHAPFLARSMHTLCVIIVVVADSSSTMYTWQVIGPSQPKMPFTYTHGIHTSSLSSFFKLSTGAQAYYPNGH